MHGTAQLSQHYENLVVSIYEKSTLYTEVNTISGIIIKHGAEYTIQLSAYFKIFTYLLTPWSRVLLEKLTGSAASQEIPHIFENISEQ